MSGVSPVPDQLKNRPNLRFVQEALGIIHTKVEIYARHLAAGTADRLWRNGPECD